MTHRFEQPDVPDDIHRIEDSSSYVPDSSRPRAGHRIFSAAEAASANTTDYDFDTTDEFTDYKNPEMPKADLTVNDAELLAAHLQAPRPAREARIDDAEVIAETHDEQASASGPARVGARAMVDDVLLTHRPATWQPSYRDERTETQEAPQPTDELGRLAEAAFSQVTHTERVEPTNPPRADQARDTAQPPVEVRERREVLPEPPGALDRRLASSSHVAFFGPPAVVTKALLETTASDGEARRDHVLAIHLEGAGQPPMFRRAAEHQNGYHVAYATPARLAELLKPEQLGEVVAGAIAVQDMGTSLFFREVVRDVAAAFSVERQTTDGDTTYIRPPLSKVAAAVQFLGHERPSEVAAHLTRPELDVVKSLIDRNRVQGNRSEIQRLAAFLAAACEVQPYPAGDRLGSPVVPNRRPNQNEPTQIVTEVAVAGSGSLTDGVQAALLIHMLPHLLRSHTAYGQPHALVMTGIRQPALAEQVRGVLEICAEQGIVARVAGYAQHIEVIQALGGGTYALGRTSEADRARLAQALPTVVGPYVAQANLDAHVNAGNASHYGDSVNFRSSGEADTGSATRSSDDSRGGTFGVAQTIAPEGPSATPGELGEIGSAHLALIEGSGKSPGVFDPATRARVGDFPVTQRAEPMKLPTGDRVAAIALEHAGVEAPAGALAAGPAATVAPTSPRGNTPNTPARPVSSPPQQGTRLQAPDEISRTLPRGRRLGQHFTLLYRQAYRHMPWSEYLDWAFEQVHRPAYDRAIAAGERPVPWEDYAHVGSHRYQDWLNETGLSIKGPGKL
ncbi:MAG TPA: hypothetical protein VLF91_05985 [Candidatus Saccharimonadales bacterium]|nr:hypothetical protein [Candidatus Saccharimonadales bacterium]